MPFWHKAGQPRTLVSLPGLSVRGGKGVRETLVKTRPSNGHVDAGNQDHRVWERLDMDGESNWG